MLSDALDATMACPLGDAKEADTPIKCEYEPISAAVTCPLYIMMLKMQPSLANGRALSLLGKSQNHNFVTNSVTHHYNFVFGDRANPFMMSIQNIHKPSLFANWRWIAHLPYRVDYVNYVHMCLSTYHKTQKSVYGL